MQFFLISKQWIYCWAQSVNINFFAMCPILIKRVDNLSQIENFPSNKYVSKMHTINNLVYRDKLHVNIIPLWIKFSRMIWFQEDDLYFVKCIKCSQSQNENTISTRSLSSLPYSITLWIEFRLPPMKLLPFTKID